MRSAAEIGLKSAVSNIPDKNKVQVLVSGSHNMITSFHQQIKNNDIRIKTNHKPKYNVTDAEDKPVDIFVHYKMDLEAWIFANTNRNKEALSLIEKALEIDGNNYEILCTKGFILYNLGQCHEAIRYYDKGYRDKSS